jgi:hypothetical protein
MHIQKLKLSNYPFGQRGWCHAVHRMVMVSRKNSCKEMRLTIREGPLTDVIFIVLGGFHRSEYFDILRGGRGG